MLSFTPLILTVIATFSVIVTIKVKDMLKVSLIVSALYTLFKYINVYEFSKIYPYGFTWAHLLNDWKEEYLSFILISYLFLIPTSLLALRFRNKLFWGSKKKILLGILLGIVMLLVLSYLFMNRFSRNPLTYVLTAITWSFLGGFTEEPLYRGTLMASFKERFNWLVALPFQALIFGISHIWSFEAVTAGFIFGLILGIFTRYLGIGSAIAIHFFMNLVAHNLL